MFPIWKSSELVSERSR